jgi:ferric-dicitrate binding protein FerR (iron transport regulator)
MQRAIVDPQERDRADDWQGVWTKIEEKENEQKVAARYLYRLGRVAAIVIAAALIGALATLYFWHSDIPQPVADATIKMIKGKNHIKLDDGTVIDLNEGSTLSYSVDFGAAKERVVELEGEAFFDVVHDPARPFKVKAGDVTTTVLGTAFDVRAYGDQNDIVVTVARGKVAVAGNDGPLATLTKNQQITYHKTSHKSETKKLDVVRETEWKDS